MITREYSAELISRMSGLQFFPTSPEAINELIDKLRAVARNKTHARRTVDTWLERFPQTPKPCDLIAFANEISALPEPRPEMINCGKCRNGWISSERQQVDMYLVGRENERRRQAGEPPLVLGRQDTATAPATVIVTRTYAARCDCVLGVYLANEERSRMKVSRGVPRQNEPGEAP